MCYYIWKKIYKMLTSINQKGIKKKVWTYVGNFRSSFIHLFCKKYKVIGTQKKDFCHSVYGLKVVRSSDNL